MLTNCNDSETGYYRHLKDRVAKKRFRMAKNKMNKSTMKSPHISSHTTKQLSYTSDHVENKIQSTAVLSYLLCSREKEKLYANHSIEQNNIVHKQLQEIMARRPVTTSSIKPSDIVKHAPQKHSRAKIGGREKSANLHRARLNTSTRFDSVSEKIADFEKKTNRVTPNSSQTTKIFCLPYERDNFMETNETYLNRRSPCLTTPETVPLYHNSSQNMREYRQPPNLSEGWSKSKGTFNHPYEPAQLANFNSYSGYITHSSRHPETLCWSRYYANSLMSPENWYFATNGHIMSTPFRYRQTWDEIPSSIMHRNRQFRKKNYSKAFLFGFVSPTANSYSERAKRSEEERSSESTKNPEKQDRTYAAAVIEMTPKVKTKPLRRGSKTYCTSLGTVHRQQRGLKRTLLALLGFCLLLIAVICIAYHII
ncbi:uncharacterized protein LOC120342521 [Styela clava]